MFSRFYLLLHLRSLTEPFTWRVCRCRIPDRAWSPELLAITAPHAADALRSKLCAVELDPGAPQMGKIGKYFVERYGFREDCIVAPFTGDNPSTLLSFSLSQYVPSFPCLQCPHIPDHSCLFCLQWRRRRQSRNVRHGPAWLERLPTQPRLPHLWPSDGRPQRSTEVHDDALLQERLALARSHQGRLL